MRSYVLALAMAGFLLAVPAVAAADYLQPGYDAAGTGAMPDPGPALNDTAFRGSLPGPVKSVQWFGGGSTMGEPLIVDGQAYIPLGNETDCEGIFGELFIPCNPHPVRGVARVNLSSADVELLLETERDLNAWTGIAIADDRILVPSNEGLEAFETSTGDPIWTAGPPPGGSSFCQAPAVAGGVAFLACAGSDGPRAESGIDPILWAVEVETGEVLWSRSLGPLAEAQADQPLRVKGSGSTSWSLGVSVSGDLVFPVTIETQQGQCVGTATSYTLWAVQAATGEVQWSRSTTLGASLHPESATGEPPLCRPSSETDAPGDGEILGNHGAFPKMAPRATATPRTVYSNLAGTLEAINPHAEDPTPLWQAELGQEDATSRTFIGPSSALVDGTLYAASSQSIYRIEADSGQELWRVAVALDEEIAPGSLLVADGTVYAMTHKGDFSSSALYAFDADTGERSWRYVLHPRGGTDGVRFSFGLGDGVIVVAGTDTSIHVIGRTDASMGQLQLEPEMYPPTGEPVTLEIPPPDPGALGPATRYMVDWGDGTVTGWQEDPLFTHVYQDEEEVTARVVAGNEAGQTTSTFVTMNVGQEAPTEPNWVSQRFEPENQDMTFGVLGILIAVTGGAIGVTSRYRKRSRLQEELAAVEAAYEATKARPLECEAQLTERKTHARGLVLDGELDEQQFGVIEQRIEELLKGVRMGAMEDEFDFLPHGLVKRAREMLADGTVSSLEREAFLRAVDEDELLSSQQKATVRDRIEAWRARDAGRGER